MTPLAIHRTLAAFALIAGGIAISAEAFPGSALPEPPEVGPTIESVPDAVVARQARDRAVYRAGLDRRMAEEGRDEVWAEKIEADLLGSLASARELDFMIRDLDCARTICRVILDHGTFDGQSATLMETAGRPGFELEGLAHLEWDGGIVSHIYLLREGETWPPHAED